MIAHRPSIPGRREAEDVNELLVSPKIVVAHLAGRAAKRSSAVPVEN